MTNTTYPKEHIDIKIPHGLRDHVIVSNTIKNIFNLETESTYETHSIVKNVGRALVKKKLLMLGSKEIVTIKLSGKGPGEKLLQDIQSANGLKARVLGRWCGNNSYNQEKCNQKGFW